MLTPRHARVIKMAVGYFDAGPVDGWPQRDLDTLNQAGTLLEEAPPQAVWVPFSQQELALLVHAVSNGAGDDAINNLGLRADQKRTLGRLANRILDAGKFGGPRWYE